MKQVIRLSENDLRNIVLESIYRYSNGPQNGMEQQQWGTKMHNNILDPDEDGYSVLFNRFFGGGIDNHGIYQTLYKQDKDNVGMADFKKEYWPQYDLNMDNADTMDEAINRAIRKTLKLI